MRTDPLALVISYLKARPELSGVPVQADLIGHATGAALVHVEVSGGTRAVRDKADLWHLSISYYGPDKRSTVALALATREVLLEHLPGRNLHGVTVADVSEGTAPSDFSESVAGEQRYLHLVSLLIYI